MVFKLLPICVLLAFHYSLADDSAGHLKIAMVNAQLDPFDIKDSNGGASGFLFDLIDDLMHRVNASYDIHWIDFEDDAPESAKRDKVRDALVKGEADIALMPLADTDGWNGVIQLSQPFLLTPFVPLVAKKLIDGSKSILDKVRQGQIKGLYVDGSSMAGMIEKDSRSPAKDLRDLFGQANDSRVPHHHGGVARIQSEPDRLALFGEELRLRKYVLQAKACDLGIDYKSVIGIGAYSLPISLNVKDQLLISSINSNLLNMRQDGSIARMKNKWWPTPADAACKPADDIFGSLENYY